MITKRIFIIMLLGVLISAPCQSQIIKGTLVTEEAEPISFALVSLYQLPDSTVVGQLFPSETGIFSFDNLQKGTYRVVIEGGLGFEIHQSAPLVIEEKAGEYIDLSTITLAYAAIEGETVVVTAERAKPLLEYDIDKTTMNIEGSSLSTMPSLLQILKLAPTVSVQGEQLTIAGKGNVLLLINGKRTNLKLENIPPNIIESVEIISNPSAQYDANVEAVLNVKIKKGGLEGIQGTVYAKYIQGVYPRAEAGATINFNKKKFSAQIDMGYEYSKIRSISDFNRKFEANTPAFYSTTDLVEELESHNLYSNLTLEWAFNDNHSIEALGSFSNGFSPANVLTQVDNFTSKINEGPIDSSLNNKTTTETQTINYQTQLSYNGKFGEEWTLFSAINYMNLAPSNRASYSFDFDNALSPSNSFDFDYQMNDSTKAGILIGQADMSWNKKVNRIDFGAQYTNINTYYSIVFNNNDVRLTGNSNWFQYNESIYAAYLQWKGGWKKWQWRFGIRGEYATTQGTDRQDVKTDVARFDYFPSAAFLYAPSDAHVFRLTYRKSIERVSFFNRSPYLYYTGLYTNFEGNPALRPQITHSVEFDYILMGLFNLNVYYNEVNDYINQVSEQEGTLVTFKSINFQNSNYGASLSGQLALSDWWQIAFKFGGTGIYTRGEIQGERFDTRSTYMSIDVMQSFNLWDFVGLDATVSYTSPYSVGIYNTGYLFYADLNLYKTFLDDQLTVSIYASDLFGTNLVRNSINFDNQQMAVVHNRDVRTVTLSLQYNFSKGRQKEIEASSTLNGNTIERVLKD